jgi:molybdopterin/thiamine biosynthesis adenylyltransferase/rhodanese-related sulfurtransferase
VSVSGQELLRRVREHIVEVDPTDVLDQLGSPDVTIIDVREAEEVAQGKIRGAVHVPRSYLETRIEGIAPDRSKRVILYCASGNRSAFGAKTLTEDMGYEHVESLTGGITLWKDRGYPVEVPRTLTPDQRQRYSRHLLLPEVGADGQQKLLDAKVLLLGAGGLGSPTALYLAAAGVGTIGIVDDDVVDVSNLQRQVIHTTGGVGELKVDSAERAINDLNPDVKVVKYATRLDASNIVEIVEGWDMVVDGVDNFPTRYLLNDATVRMRIPVVSAAILGFEGQLSVFQPYEGPCYRCLFRQPPPAELAPSCGANGVLGVLPGTMGLLQATEVVKLILGVGDPLIGRLLMYDALGATVTELKVRRDPECPICSRDPDEIADDELGVFPDYEAFCAAAG